VPAFISRIDGLPKLLPVFFLFPPRPDLKESTKSLPFESGVLKRRSVIFRAPPWHGFQRAGRGEMSLFEGAETVSV
jgi:hypothetical protein